MVSNFVTENIKFILGCDKLFFVRVGWVWMPPGVVDLKHTEKTNDVHGILIFNIAYNCLNALNVEIDITDNKLGQVVYKAFNSGVQDNVLGNFVYFIPDNSMNFSSNDKIKLGFNFVTIRKG